MGRHRISTEESVLDAIRYLSKLLDMPPTITELRDYLGVGSTRTVTRYLGWLEESGAIKRWPGARGIKVLRRAR